MVPGHRIGAVVRQLGIELSMQRLDESRIICAVAQLCAGRHLLGVDAQLALRRGLQLGKSRHLLAVNMRRAGKVTGQELVLDLSEMSSEPLDLLGVRRTLGHDTLDSALRSFRENLLGGRQAERHQVGAALRYFGLPLGICGCCDGRPGGEPKQDECGKHVEVEALHAELGVEVGRGLAQG